MSSGKARPEDTAGQPRDLTRTQRLESDIFRVCVFLLFSLNFRSAEPPQSRLRHPEMFQGRAVRIRASLHPSRTPSRGPLLGMRRQLRPRGRPVPRRYLGPADRSSVRQPPPGPRCHLSASLSAQTLVPSVPSPHPPELHAQESSFNAPVHAVGTNERAGPGQEFCLSDNKLFDPALIPLLIPSVSAPGRPAAAHGHHADVWVEKPGLLGEARHSSREDARALGPQCAAWASWPPAQEGGTERGSPTWAEARAPRAGAS